MMSDGRSGGGDYVAATWPAGEAIGEARDGKVAAPVLAGFSSISCPLGMDRRGAKCPSMPLYPQGTECPATGRMPRLFHASPACARCAAPQAHRAFADPCWKRSCRIAAGRYGRPIAIIGAMPLWNDEPPRFDQAARILPRKRSTSARSVAAWPLSCSAENNTLLAADPVLSAALLTAEMLLDTWPVPCAAS